MVKVNYKNEKRQKELEKKKKRDQKIKSKIIKKDVQSPENTGKSPEQPAKE